MTNDNEWTGGFGGVAFVVGTALPALLDSSSRFS